MCSRTLCQFRMESSVLTQVKAQREELDPDMGGEAESEGFWEEVEGSTRC